MRVHPCAESDGDERPRDGAVAVLRAESALAMIVSRGRGAAHCVEPRGVDGALRRRDLRCCVVRRGVRAPPRASCCAHRRVRSGRARRGAWILAWRGTWRGTWRRAWRRSSRSSDGRRGGVRCRPLDRIAAAPRPAEQRVPAFLARRDRCRALQHTVVDRAAPRRRAALPALRLSNMLGGASQIVSMIRAHCNG